ncbi:MAG: SOS response-associated peptidase [Acholeplasmatales bacterium]|nr:MAG: SOS response-associated peptidase [Acholeplasmatales bacterium]
MCGRFKLDVEVSFLQQYLFEVFAIPQFDGNQYVPRREIRPSDTVLTLIHDSHRYRVGPLKWGFLPSYAKHAKDRPLINAKGETLSQKAPFKKAFKSQRCIVLADSFYEWRETASGKQPMRIWDTQRAVMPLAGLWNTYKDASGSATHTCAIITVAANAVIEPIHARMPLILDAESLHSWLRPPVQDVASLAPLLRSFPAASIHIEPVQL